jgi:hypothetical protein
VLLAACGGGTREDGGADATPPSPAAEATGASPAPAATPSPALSPTALAHRTSCDAIRTTQYQSEAEKQWFIANCTNAVSQPLQRGPDAGTNLLANASFEAGPGDWALLRPGVSPGPPLLDTAISHTGVHSARLDNVFGGNCQVVCGYRSAPISVPETPAREFRFGAWFLGSESIIGQTGALVELLVQVPDGSFQHLNEAAGVAGRGWTEAFGVGRIPPEYTTIVLEVSWRRNERFPDATGSLWIDDVSFAVAGGLQFPGACRQPSPGDNITVHAITPTTTDGLPPGVTAVMRFEFEYTLESYDSANLTFEATNSRDYPRWSVLSLPLHVLKGSGVDAVERPVPVPGSGWVDIQITLYGPSPCREIVLARIGPIRYNVVPR